MIANKTIKNETLGITDEGLNFVCVCECVSEPFIL